MKPSELLSDESKWTRGVCARDAQGNEVDVNSDKACSFCIVGALIVCFPNFQQRHKIYNTILDSEAMETFNDDPKTTFVDIKDLLEKAGL